MQRLNKNRVTDISCWRIEIHNNNTQSPTMADASVVDLLFRYGRVTILDWLLRTYRDYMTKLLSNKANELTSEARRNRRDPVLWNPNTKSEFMRIMAPHLSI